MSRRILLIAAAAIGAVALLAGALWWQASRPRTHYAAHTLAAGPRTFELARAARFDTIVQLFSWRAIEPTRGQYHWQYPDEVVAGAAYYGMDLIVRLDQHPAWASAAPLDLNAPPDDPATYAAFAGMVAARYRGQVKAYIIWNEPNLATDWGGAAPDPAGYAALLRAAYGAIKAADPNALVVSAGLASTNDRTGQAMDDRAYLEALYAAGAGPYFDVLGAHPYGFAYPPEDPHGAHDGLNLARLADLRAIMVRHGDAAKPVWATEMGWTVNGTGAAAWQTVTPEQQASYLSRALRDAPRAWPWLTLVAVWNLDGAENPDWAGYSLLDPAGIPRPAYQALSVILPAARLPTTEQLLKSGRRALAALASNWSARPAPARQFTILASDAVIHLGDSQYSEPWMPLYANRNPSPTWQGTLYLPDDAVTSNQPDVAQASLGIGSQATPTSGPHWHLTLRLMQSNTWDNYLWINGHRLEPPLPQTDYTNSWVSVTVPVPADILRPGPNDVRLTIGRAVPLLQDQGFAWDDLQFKDILLTSEP
jgi:polysaccharide biosynthesis protein PslG